MREAKTLQEHQYYGRGSKWRARLVSGGLLAIMLVAVGIRFKQEIAPRDRPWFLLVAAMIFAAVLVFNRLTRRETGGAVESEVSEREMVFVGSKGRTAIQWTGFSQCLESPNVFVLVDRARTALFVVPKRAFPDEAARNWFRTQANQPQSAAVGMPDETLVPGRFVSANGIALTLRLRFVDYLNRHFTSWRMKGAFLGILALLTAINFLSSPPPGAVNSASKTFAIMVPMFLGAMVFVIVVISVVSWFGERRHLGAQQLVVTDKGIEFSTQDSHGLLPWSTYKFYLENRFSFFVWNPRGSLWCMFPKREFGSASDVAQFRAMLEAKLKRSRWFYL